jgi:hypothetical protein
MVVLLFTEGDHHARSLVCFLLFLAPDLNNTWRSFAAHAPGCRPVRHMSGSALKADGSLHCGELPVRVRLGDAAAIAQ